MLHKIYRSGGKRAFDVLISLVGLILLAPVFLLVSIVVFFKLGRPIIFRQQRPGLNARPFMLYKFRTMLNTNDSAGRPLPDAERLTPFGRFLRSTSLDELPELFNVVRGDMSLVGPRPLLLQYLKHYTPQQARRHEVRPGITGWAQINGRNALSWAERFTMDVWYVEHCTLWLDLRILWLTVVQVLKRENINRDGHATMPEFTGPD